MRTKLRDAYRGFLWLGLAGAVALPVVVITQPPSFQDGLLLSVLLVSVFFLVASLVAGCGVWFRHRQELNRGEGYVFVTSLRQGALAGAATVTLLLLQLLRVVTPIDTLLFVGLAVMIELYFGSRTESS